MGKTPVKKAKVNVSTNETTLIDLIAMDEAELQRKLDNFTKQIDKVYKHIDANEKTYASFGTGSRIKTDSPKSKSTKSSTSTPLFDSELLSSSLGKKILKGATDKTFLESLSGGTKTAATMLGGLANKSSLVAKGLGLLTGSIDPTVMALQFLTWTVSETADAFIEAYGNMKDLANETVAISRYTGTEIMAASSYYGDIRKSLNAQFGKILIGNEDIVKSLSAAFKMFKNDSEAVAAFADETLLLNEMGVDFQGSVGTLLRNQYYRTGRDTEATNSYLDTLVSISSSSLLSLEEIAAVELRAEESANNITWNLDAYTDATDEELAQITENIKQVQAAAYAAAVTTDSQAAVDRATAMIKELISAGADNPDAYALYGQYKAEGLLGNMSMQEIVDGVRAGNYGNILKEIIINATEATKSQRLISGTAAGGSGGIQAITNVLGKDEVSTFITDFNKYYEEAKNPTTTAEDQVEKELHDANDYLKGIFEVLAYDILDVWDPAKVDEFFTQKEAAQVGTMGGSAATVIINNVNAEGKYDPTMSTDSNATPIPGSEPFWTPIQKAIDWIFGKGGPAALGGVGGPSWTSASDTIGTNPWRLSAGFKSPAYRAQFGRDHTGADYAASAGTSIPSTVNGTVIEVGNNSVSGNYVKVQDDIGRIHMFAHMQATSVQKGQRVSVGMELGKVGSTGRSTGPHVHYQVSSNGTAINPAPWAAGTFGNGRTGTSTTVLDTTPASTAQSTTATTTASMLKGISYKDYSNSYSTKLITSGVGGPSNTTMSSAMSSSSRYTNDTTSAVVSLTSLVSEKLDIIIDSMTSGTKYTSDLKNQFIYTK